MAWTGRPPKYKKEYCKQLVEHMAKGLSFESFAGRLLVGRATLYRWEEQHADFRDAKKAGLELCRLWWEEQSTKHLTKNGNTKLNAPIWIFSMKNRFRDDWSDNPSEIGESNEGKKGNTQITLNYNLGGATNDNGKENNGKEKTRKKSSRTKSEE